MITRRRYSGGKLGAYGAAGRKHVQDESGRDAEHAAIDEGYGHRPRQRSDSNDKKRAHTRPEAYINQVFLESCMAGIVMEHSWWVVSEGRA
jgi:hypothetical protein